MRVIRISTVVGFWLVYSVGITLSNNFFGLSEHTEDKLISLALFTILLCLNSQKVDE